MAPLKPHWAQPSHPDIHQVIVNEAEFTSKSLSKVTVPPFGVFAKMTFPPCTITPEATYATVQIGKNRHISLNSDLLYLNHSCDPSLILDTANLDILAGPKGLKPGDELTFFYPSTEWHMAQPFDCLCQSASCRGTITGAQGMDPRKLEGFWLSGHIRQMLEEKATGKPADAHADVPDLVGDATAQLLRAALSKAEDVASKARAALDGYTASTLVSLEDEATKGTIANAA
ncbi:uncharacterized protein F5Z01DRAFT_409281 [Emericellopsis atlantica]|uniref:Post-SET domain-containing protein n=1 Tax=Emericellopsis atlantica TaxID=2614577 RepID=A0A9P8CS44_9HYPO|nr:uncharacterized protein F5Z01DRAFT_409281 [Emericellopsis atlantica]KAG9257669.1 hypothetical protein F5Z01DRAFT_409281 [Emericellopsis atlantica]